MAAYNYYQSHAQPYYDQPNRLDAPLPPQPSRTPDPPLEGRHYPYQHAGPSQSFTGSNGALYDEPDAYDDGNAISMSGRKAKHDSTHTVTPILPHEEEDMFVRDIDPSKARRQARQKDGWFTGRVTWAVYVLTLIELIVFIAEIIRNAVLTKSPIEIHPSFNPMIGPSPYVMINMGARYQPCMHNMANVQNSSVEIYWPCPNATSTTGSSVSCSLSELCGFNGVPNPHVGGSITETPAPNQWWRFIVPIFIHAGIVHIGFNLLLQMTLGRDVERLIGTVRFTIVYFAAGIFGFILGGNFAADGIASCGCSGSLFGILGITLLDLLYTWKTRPSPGKDLLFIFIDFCIAFVLGLLPGVDNFSHIGGFLMGLVLGVCILRSPTAISRRTTASPRAAPYLARAADRNHGVRELLRDPAGFFAGRQGVWWAWGGVRALGLLFALVATILLLKNFYVWDHTCSWCKYLSCLPVTVDGENWCSVGNLDFTSTTTSSDSTSNSTSLKRELFALTGNALELAWRG